jgi:acyl carrier protein
MQFNKAQIQDGVVKIIEDTIHDWDVDLDGAIGTDTKLVADLGFSSIDIIHFTVAVEEHFNRPKMGFNELLMVDGKYIDDLQVKQVVDFLDTKLNNN